jgi:hypothetical protein
VRFVETVAYPLVTFSCEFDDQTAFEVEEKGFFDHAVVTLADGSRYGLHFYDPVRLERDLRTEQKHCGACVGEPGLAACGRSRSVPKMAGRRPAPPRAVNDLQACGACFRRTSDFCHRLLVVIPRVTKCNTELAVRQLAENGYFSSLVPLTA